MAEDEPTPPPENSDDQPEDEEPGAVPFLNATSGAQGNVAVTAGWADEETGDAIDLVVNYNGAAGSPTTLSAYETALEWYRDALAAIYREHQQDREEAEMPGEGS